MAKTVNNQLDLQKAIIKQVPEIAIAINPQDKAVNIHATGSVAWFVCATFFCLSLALLLYNPYIQNLTNKIVLNNYPTKSLLLEKPQDGSVITGAALPLNITQMHANQKKIAKNKFIKKVLLITASSICIISGCIALLVTIGKNNYDVIKKSEDKIILKLKE